MRLFVRFSTLASSVLLLSCMQKGTNPIDPYEPLNRKFHDFNMTLDKAVMKPVANLYVAIVPGQLRKGINNAYNNLTLISTTANDLLQGECRQAIKDGWRFVINSSFGIGGFFDVADSTFGLPPHKNDLGLTFAKWGDKKSPYLVIPFLGPSTIRDGMSLPFDYMLSPYPYMPGALAFTALSGGRYIDLRAQLLDHEKLLDEAFDKYTFIRDAYLQHRNYLITGEQEENGNDSLYVDEGAAADYIDGDAPADYVDDLPKGSSYISPLPHRN